eukprot:4793977-Pyramimonas_sp.AAC.1
MVAREAKGFPTNTSSTYTNETQRSILSVSGKIELSSDEMGLIRSYGSIPLGPRRALSVRLRSLR